MQQELEAKELEASVGGGAITVKVNGKILEQDNVKKLFKKGRQCVSAVEIFVELFCGNVKTIKFIK